MNTHLKKHLIDKSHKLSSQLSLHIINLAMPIDYQIIIASKRKIL